jgi:predicted ferric reductase
VEGRSRRLTNVVHEVVKAAQRGSQVTATAQEPHVAAPSVLVTAVPGRPARAHPNLVLVVVGLGAFAVLGLWWRDTPSISGLGDWLTNAGRITGLLAGYTMVVLLALMARLPPLERGVGADRLARWHAMGGRYAVSLVVAHGLLITWGYAVSAHTNVVDQAQTLVMRYPDVLAATVAGLLLVGVGITSARAARRRLRYETWYYLHFYTYLAVALAFSHQFATGADFMANRSARIAWAGMYAAVGAAILWYRFVTPIRQAIRHRLRVQAVHHEADGVVSVVVSGRHLHELQAQTGQFFRWRFLTRDLWWVSSPYSLSAPVLPDRLRITVKALGDHSRAVAQVEPGTRLLAEGPYGAMTAVLRTRRKVLLVAGGVGITPLRALFQTIPAGPGDLTLLYRASREADVVFRAELESIAAHRQARLHIITGRRADLGGDPLSASLLKANIPDLAEHDVYLCGPTGMTSSAIAALRRAGVPRRRIHHESFEF